MARMIKKKKVDWFCDITGKSLPPPFLIMEGGVNKLLMGLWDTSCRNPIQIYAFFVRMLQRITVPISLHYRSSGHEPRGSSDPAHVSNRYKTHSRGWVSDI